MVGSVHRGFQLLVDKEISIMMKRAYYFIITWSFILSNLLAMAYGFTPDPKMGQEKAGVCATCHGPDGNSPSSAFPKIAGQNLKYIVKQLMDYKKGDQGGRNNAIMYPIVTNLDKADMENLAAYFSGQPTTPGEANAASLKIGARLYRGGDLTRGIAACGACHGPRGQGNPDAGFPALAGQYPTYIVAQLKAYRDGQRTNDYNKIMRSITKRMTDNDMEKVANFIYGLH